ncbi:MAG: HEAT repeat domain-containing protein [Phycisphaerae bacterium]
MKKIALAAALACVAAGISCKRQQSDQPSSAPSSGPRGAASSPATPAADEARLASWRRVLESGGPAGQMSGAAEGLGAARAGDAAAIAGLAKAASHADADVRMNACWALGRAGPSAKPAVGELLRALGDGEYFVRGNAAWALGQVGDAAAVAPLVKALDDKDAGVRLCACEALGRIGPPAVPALAALLRSPATSPAGTTTAAAQEGDGPDAAPFRPYSSDQPWKDEFTADRRQLALRALGMAGETAVEPLLAAMRSEEKEIAIGAALALARIGKPAVAGLLKFLDSAKGRQAAVAVGALIEMGPTAEKATPRLTAMLDSPDKLTRMGAAEALGRIGPAATTAGEALAKMAASVQPDERATAIVALGRVGSDHPKAMEALVEALSRHDRISELAAETLRAGGPAALKPLAAAMRQKKLSLDLAVPILAGLPRESTRPLLPEMIVLLKDASFGTTAAIDLMDKLGPPPPECLPALMELLKPRRPEAGGPRPPGPPGLPPFDMLRPEQQDGDVFAYACRALGQLGPAAKDAVPLMIRKDREGNEYVAPDAVEALGRIGPAAAQAAPAILRSNSWPSSRGDSREKVLAALKGIGPAAIPALVAALKPPAREATMGPDLESRSALALEALVAIGPEAGPALAAALQNADKATAVPVLDALARLSPPKQALAELRRLLKDPDKDIKERACKALAAMKAEAAPAIGDLIPMITETEGGMIWTRASYEAIAALAAIGQPALGPLLEAFKGSQEKLHERVAKAIGSMGKTAAPAVPILIKAVRDNDDYDAAEALGDLGETARDAVPVLLESLRNTKKFGTGRAAAWALAKIPHDRKASAPVLLDVLSTSRDVYLWQEVLTAARETLIKFGPDALPAIDAKIREALAAKDSAGRWTKDGLLFSMCKHKVEINPDAQDVIPILIELMTKYDFRQAREILRDMGPIVIPQVLPLLKSDNRDVKTAAREMLDFMSPGSARELMALERLANHADGDVRTQAAILLRKYGKIGNRVWQEGLRDPNLEVVKYCAGKIDQMDLLDHPNTDQYIEELRKDGRAEVRKAGDALAAKLKAQRDMRQRSLDAHARGVEEDLPRDWFRPPTDEESAATGYDPKLAEGVPALVARLKKATGGEQRDIIESLGELGPSARDAAPELAAIMKSGRSGGADHNGWAARDALRRIGPEAKAVVPIMIELLEDEKASAQDRREPCHVLEAIGPAAAPAVPALIKALKSKDADMCRSAVATLAAIGPAASAAVEPLQALARQRNQDSFLEIDARNAVGKIRPSMLDGATLLVNALKYQELERYAGAYKQLHAKDPTIKTEAAALTAALRAINDAIRDKTGADAWGYELGIPLRRLAVFGADARAAQVEVARAAAVEPQAAASALEAIGADAAVAPALLEAAKARLYLQGQYADSIVAAIARLGKPGVRAARPLLAGEKDGRMFALAVLAASEGDAAEAFDEVWALYRSAGEDESLRAACLGAMAAMGPAAAPAVDELIKIIAPRRDYTGFSRQGWAQAARCLGRIGPPARKALPALMAAAFNYYDRYEDNEEGTLAAARLAITVKEAAPQAAHALPRQLAAICGNQSGQSEEAAEVLALWGPAAKSAAPQLVELLRTMAREDADRNVPHWPDRERWRERTRAKVIEALTRMLGHPPELPTQPATRPGTVPSFGTVPGGEASW